MTSRTLPVFAMWLVVTSLLVLPICPGAQKAEPSRIQFPRGSTGTRMTGVLRDRQSKEYVLSAVAGQRLQCQLQSSPARSTSVKLVDLNNREVPLTRLAAGLWAVTLPQSGEFVILISRVRLSRGRSTFSLKIEIK